jgi:hypothetical protein
MIDQWGVLQSGLGAGMHGIAMRFWSSVDIFADRTSRARSIKTHAKVIERKGARMILLSNLLRPRLRVRASTAAMKR